MIPFVFWVGTALFLICAYPIAPPGEVSGFSSFILGNALFLIATCCLVIFVFQKGNSPRRSDKKIRILKRLTYSWLCVIVLFGYVAISDLVRRGGAQYINMPIMVGYGIVFVFLSGVFFTLRRWVEGGRSKGIQDR